MTDMGEILVVIPARGGSKRVPRKNVLPLAGKPLICWAIEAALGAGLNARILVTSDDEEVLAIARQYESKGVTVYKRPYELATDTASTVDVLKDVVNVEQAAGYTSETLVLLQPTSPLRTAEDIRAALQIYLKGACEDSVVSVSEVEHPTAWVGTLSDSSRLNGVNLTGKRSQDHHKEYRLNGAVYVVRADVVLNQHSMFTKELWASVMPRDRAIDIDEELDFKICEVLLARG